MLMVFQEKLLKMFKFWPRTVCIFLWKPRLISITLQIQNSYLYTDQIEFDSNSNLQKVELVTLVKDAVFIYPNRDNTTKVIETLTLNIGGEQVETDLQGRELLPEELTFTNEKPYVIYGFAAVPNGETLTIDPGARIAFS